MPLPKPENNQVYCYDRQEEGLFVLSGPDGHEIAVPALPEGTRPGDSLRYLDGAFVRLEEESERRRENIARLLDRVIRRREDRHQ